MNFVDETKNVKRAKLVIIWSAIYLATCWLSVLSSILNTDANVFLITDLLAIPLFPVVITTFILAWLWLRSVLITARSIDAIEVGYRQGWAFWGWVTPIAAWWIPRKLIAGSQRVFTTYLGESNSLRLGTWWGLFVACTILDNFSFRASLAGSEGFVAFDILSAILLTIAFPSWKLIVETVTKDQQNVLAKKYTEAA